MPLRRMLSIPIPNDRLPAVLRRIASPRRAALAWLMLGAIATGTARANQDDTKRYVDESRKASLQVLQQIRGELVKEMENSGPLRAIIVCKYTAPEVTSGVSRKTGWRVSRVSLRARNPALGTPDAWEQKVLMDFDQRSSKGEKPESIEHHEYVSEPTGRFFRYMRAIPTAPECLGCHGSNVTDAVKSQLANEYPNDRATGYFAGQIRGAVTVKRPLPN